MSDVHLALFDLYAEGHHPEYIDHLCSSWLNQPSDGKLEVVGPSTLLEHPDLDNRLRSSANEHLSFNPVPGTDPRRSLLGAGIDHWRQLKRYIDECQPDHVLLMYFDHVQLGLALNLRPEGRTTFSGIYFRPIQLSRGHIDKEESFSRESSFLSRVRKQALFTLARRNPRLERLYVLDPVVAPSLEKGQNDVDIRLLPEPITPPEVPGSSVPTGNRVRADLEIGEDQQLLLLFGMLTPRKGVIELLIALEHLDTNEFDNATILLAGPVDEKLEDEIKERIQRHSGRGGPRVELRNDFIPPELHDSLFRAADALLMPYQHHVGMSAVLVRGAAYGLPVVGPDTGTLGALIRRHGLGRAIDTSNPSALAKAIEALLREGPPEEFDPERARSFAAGHTPEAFAETVLEPVLRSGKPGHSNAS